MDCRRRSAVDDDRSRRIRLAVDDDRHQRRWVVDDDRSRIAFYQAQVKASLDRVDKNLDQIDKNLRSIRRMRMPSATIPASSSSFLASASRDLKRFRNQPIMVDDYPPLELPLRWRNRPPLQCAPPDCTFLNRPAAVFSDSPPLKHAMSQSDLPSRTELPSSALFDYEIFASAAPIPSNQNVPVQPQGSHVVPKESPQSDTMLESNSNSSEEDCISFPPHVDSKERQMSSPTTLNPSAQVQLSVHHDSSFTPVHAQSKRTVQLDKIDPMQPTASNNECNSEDEMEQSEGHTDSNADMDDDDGCAIRSSSDLLDRETDGQAFYSALQDELSDYYKLLTVLESPFVNPIPSVVSDSGRSPGNCLSLRRLPVWLTEPMVRMRLMALLVDGINVSTRDCLQGILSEVAMDYSRFGKRITKYLVGQIIIVVARCTMELSISGCLHMVEKSFPDEKSRGFVTSISSKVRLSTLPVSSYYEWSRSPLSPMLASNPAVSVSQPWPNREWKMNTMPEIILLVGTFGVIISFGPGQTNYYDLRNIFGMARCSQDLLNSVCQQRLDGVVGRLLVDRVAYAKSYAFDAALPVFAEMPYHDIAILNTLISGYEHIETPKEAQVAFNELQDANVEPNQLTLVVALSAYSQLGAIETDMHSKCEDLENALYVFRFVKNRNVFVWSSMIAGLTMHGRVKKASDSFKDMQEAEVKLSHVTFTKILNACSHAELVEEGRMYSSQMLHLHGIAPDIEHYGCMVDILSRAGYLEEAIDPRCKVFDPGGLIIISTSISLPITRFDGVEHF